MSSSVVRLVRLLAVFVCGAGVFCLVGAVSASADVWTTEGGTHYLKSGGGELIKSWTAKEWQVWRKEVQAVGECMGVLEQCAQHEFAGETSVEDMSKGGTEDAQNVVAFARAESLGLARSVLTGLDRAGEDSYTLPREVGASVIANVGLSSQESYVVGVELGNGLDQLFEVPVWSPLDEAEQKSVESKPLERLVTAPISFEEPRKECPSGTASCKESFYELQPGYYIQQWGGKYDRLIESGERLLRRKRLQIVLRRTSGVL